MIEGRFGDKKHVICGTCNGYCGWDEYDDRTGYFNWKSCRHCAGCGFIEVNQEEFEGA